MDKPKRKLLSCLAAFRNPTRREALTALNPFRSEKELDAALEELIDRGLLLFDRGQARYDLHPVVRQHAYDRLTDKAKSGARPGWPRSKRPRKSSNNGRGTRPPRKAKAPQKPSGPSLRTKINTISPTRNRAS